MDASNLTELYRQLVSEQLAAEKKYAAVITKVAAASSVNELRGAVSIDATAIDTHISRLTDAGEAVKYKKSMPLTSIDNELLRSLKSLQGKKASTLIDAELLHLFKAIYTLKIDRYETLAQLANAIEQTTFTPLLEQTIRNNQNTVAYLNQISQNIIYPAATKA